MFHRQRLRFAGSRDGRRDAAELICYSHPERETERMTRRDVRIDEMTEDQGFRFELAREVLSDEIGRRVAEIRALPSGDERASRERI